MRPVAPPVPGVARAAGRSEPVVAMELRPWRTVRPQRQVRPPPVRPPVQARSGSLLPQRSGPRVLGVALVPPLPPPDVVFVLVVLALGPVPGPLRPVPASGGAPWRLGPQAFGWASRPRPPVTAEDACVCLVRLADSGAGGDPKRGIGAQRGSGSLGTLLRRRWRGRPPTLLIDPGSCGGASGEDGGAEGRGWAGRGGGQPPQSPVVPERTRESGWDRVASPETVNVPSGPRARVPGATPQCPGQGENCGRVSRRNGRVRSRPRTHVGRSRELEGFD